MPCKHLKKGLDVLLSALIWNTCWSDANSGSRRSNTHAFCLKLLSLQPKRKANTWRFKTHATEPFSAFSVPKFTNFANVGLHVEVIYGVVEEESVWAGEKMFCECLWMCVIFFCCCCLANVPCYSAKQRRPEQTMAIAGHEHKARLLMKSIRGLNSCETKK